MVKSCLYHGILECILVEVFYFRLNKVTQQTIDVVFVSDMLKSTYNKIKITLGLMARNYKEWDDNNLTKMQWWHFKAK